MHARLAIGAGPAIGDSSAASGRKERWSERPMVNGMVWLVPHGRVRGGHSAKPTFGHRSSSFNSAYRTNCGARGHPSFLPWFASCKCMMGITGASNSPAPLSCIQWTEQLIVSSIGHAAMHPQSASFQKLVKCGVQSNKWRVWDEETRAGMLLRIGTACLSPQPDAASGPRIVNPGSSCTCVCTSKNPHSSKSTPAAVAYKSVQR
ncbi:hypothetical protein FB567DRAFT_607433 [Paraphoma chrysanthemicola]|uniref:Uncharacterized protein n=1 Tax=Paraphoma chrysanthemicola TaxID=798071 RepID=A0A8K0QYK4_9PLEO|nr:hypothetical protein FB567DRAFT_607433 [Paraphoma chrysanthemicola]